MLKGLRIQNFAIIDALNIEFDEDMTCLTGETGAGKSIIIDAISMLMGARANASMVKSGADKAFIEGVFDIQDKPFVQQQLAENGFDVEDELVISREIQASGKSTARLNYRLVSASLLRQLMGTIIDIHSQFETQHLLNSKLHLSLLDRYLGDELQSLQTQYQKAYRSYREAKKQLEDLLATPADDEQLEFYESRIREIDEANLQAGELDQLEEEKKRMSQYEKINASVQETLSLLENDRGALTMLYEADHLLQRIDDQTLDPLKTGFEDTYYQLMDLTEQLRDYSQNLFFDEYRYQELSERIFLIHKLQKRYGYDISDILAKRDEMAEKVELIKHRDQLLDEAEQALAEMKQHASDLAAVLSMQRKEGAKKLEQAIEAELASLYMQQTRFVVQFEALDDLTADGQDRITFLISTNVGQALHPLSDVASGGELSRLMLGLKCIFSRIDGISTIIFDEVDTGVSGKVATAIGRKMKEIAHHCQVLCITHLPQVASFAAHHLYVYKEVRDNRTHTAVKWLTDHERIDEIAKMMSNDEITAQARENATALICENGKF